MTVQRTSCPECGSKDNLVIFENGGKHCYTPDCSYHVHSNGSYQEPPKATQTKVPKNVGTTSAITDRKITEKTCMKFGVTQTKDEHYYPLYSEEGSIVAYKVRKLEEKSFYSSGKISQALMFGQGIFSKGNRYLTICEGELDAMSVYQMLGSKWPAISIKNGAESAVKDVKENYDWIMSFENVHICFDNDEPGRLAAKKVAEILSPKAKIVKLRDHKDASDYLTKKGEESFVRSWWDAEEYHPDGIVAGAELWDSLIKEDDAALIRYPFYGLQKLTFGIRASELITITAGAGLGKSQFVRELLFYVLKNTSDNLGLMFMEESVKRTAESFMSLEANKPLHLPHIKEEVSEEEYKEYFDSTLGTERVFLYDHFGSNEIDTILSRVRYFANVLNCKYICLDHVSIIVSNQNVQDERRALDEIMTKLRTLVQELNIVLFLVSHLRRPTGSGHEEGAVTSLSHLRGSASIGQLSDIVIGLERNGQHEDENERHTTTVRVIKNRFSGLTGPACRLKYSLITGRMSEIDEDDLGTN